MAHFKRTLLPFARKASETFKCLLVNGPRQVGKTSLLKEMLDGDRVYVTLDDPFARSLARRDPERFLKAYPAPALIDEIQYAPNLFPYIKMAVDASQGRGQWWMTGSQQFRLMKGVSESLAGRVAILRLQGLSQREAAGDDSPAPFEPDVERPVRAVAKSLPDLAETFKRIVRGSFPEPLSVRDMDLPLFFSSYVGTYLERDIRELVSASMESAFLDFLRVLAARTSQELNFQSLARDVGVSVPTLRSWVSILETSGLVYRLRPWRANVSKRVVDTPKLHFLDTGLCCALCGIETAEEALSSPLSGALLESFCVSEVLKSHWHAGREPQLYHYRDHDGREIDMVLWARGRLFPIEVKRTASPDARDILRPWEAIRKAGLPLGPGVVLCPTMREMPLDDGLNLVNPSAL